jgi:hypothetical protein
VGDDEGGGFHARYVLGHNVRHRQRRLAQRNHKRPTGGRDVGLSLDEFRTQGLVPQHVINTGAKDRDDPFAKALDFSVVNWADTRRNVRHGFGKGFWQPGGLGRLGPTRIPIWAKSELAVAVELRNSVCRRMWLDPFVHLYL